jgi:radical SAM enzyme (TIGR04100 family)
MTISYVVGKALYLNITNRCSCNCVFCIRNNGDSVYGSDNLWLEHEPTTEEVLADLEKRDLSQFEEIVFCGYGEPTENLDTLLQVCDGIRKMTSVPIRLNTNGLADLYHKEPIAYKLKGRVDVVSISLNAGNAERYEKVTRPAYGKVSFQSMLNFASDCKKYVKKVKFTIVDILPEEELEQCKDISKRLGIELRIRKYES